MPLPQRIRSEHSICHLVYLAKIPDKREILEDLKWRRAKWKEWLSGLDHDAVDFSWFKVLWGGLESPPGTPHLTQFVIESTALGLDSATRSFEIEACGVHSGESVCTVKNK